jgi:hypothetical protein
LHLLALAGRPELHLEIRKSVPGMVAILGVFALATLWVVGMPFYFRDAALLLRDPLQAAGTYRLATVANTLLGASTALYLASLWLPGQAIRRAATWFAGLGAAAIVADILIRAMATGIHGHAFISAVSVSYELAALMVALVVATLLVGERALRSAAVGAFVMPLAMAGVATEIWLLNHGSSGSGFGAFGGLRAYWGLAYLLAQFIGYGAFLATAVIGILYLARCAAEETGILERLPRHLLPGLWRLYSMMTNAIALGLPVFLLAVLMLAGWILDRGDLDWASVSWGGWTLGVAVLYACLAYFLFGGALSGRRLATWAVMGFGASLLAFVLFHIGDLPAQITAGFTFPPGTTGCA